MYSQALRRIQTDGVMEKKRSIDLKFHVDG